MFRYVHSNTGRDETMLVVTMPAVVCILWSTTHSKVARGDFIILMLILIYLLNAIGLRPGGSSTVHIYTQTIHGTTN